MHVATNYYQMLQLARHHYGAANIDSPLTDHFICSSDLTHPVQSQIESSFVRKSSFPRILVSVAVACCIRAFHELEHTYLWDMYYRCRSSRPGNTAQLLRTTRTSLYLLIPYSSVRSSVHRIHSRYNILPSYIAGWTQLLSSLNALNSYYVTIGPITAAGNRQLLNRFILGFHVWRAKLKNPWRHPWLLYTHRIKFTIFKLPTLIGMFLSVFQKA